MTTPFLELEGTLEEIKAQLPDYGDQRIHMTISPAESISIAEENTPKSKLSITEKIIERFKNVPPEEIAKVPIDLTENLDHYIY